MQERRCATGKARFRSSRATPFWFTFGFAPPENRSGTGDSAICFDLTERKRVEAMRQSELRYRTLFDLVPVAVYACDGDGLIQEFNQRAVELWGREPKKNDPKEKFCGSFKIFSSDGRSMPHAKCPMARALKGETLEAQRLRNTDRATGRLAPERHCQSESLAQRARQNRRSNQLPLRCH